MIGTLRIICYFLNYQAGKVCFSLTTYAVKNVLVEDAQKRAPGLIAEFSLLDGSGTPSMWEILH
jgi:hypothetical protein